ncbi:MAG: SpoIIE family protein phosphatase [Pirellulaceae bacterium]|nr:SpoIIE family protein phosphatase [Pirellulaceae bacterium]
MSKPFPDYLRLHVEEVPVACYAPVETPAVAAVLAAFPSVTGWQLRCEDELEPVVEAAWTRPLDAVGSPPRRLVLVRDAAGPTGMSLPVERIRPLAQAVGELIDEVHRAQATVWQREAELAAGIPVTLRPDEQQQLAYRLESVLRGGAEVLGCDAAALYLLDDATSSLKLRAAWRLPKSRFLEPPRPLRGAVADLEALVGHAVALENTALLPHWRVPEDFPAALCVPVSSASTPLGTLWFFAQATRPFSPQQTHLAELVAGRIVSDLEREVLVREGLRERQADRARQLLEQWQEEQRPRVPPLVDGWQVAGRLLGDDPLSGGFYDWCVLPDGRIALAVGQADGPSVEASFTATTLQVALKSHAAHPHDARQMLDHLNEALWTCSTGNRFAALAYAIIDPETGSLEYAAAGDMDAVLVRPRGGELLTADNPRLGAEPDTFFSQATYQLEAGAVLVLLHRRLPPERGAELPLLNLRDMTPVSDGLPRATAEEHVQALAAACFDGTGAQGPLVVTRHIF